MLTRLRIRHFKLFDDVEIELGQPVVFIGPNNSGKTTALQALALWAVGLQQWKEKRGGQAPPEKRPGVTINRLELAQIPIPRAKLLWRRTELRRKTVNLRIEIVVDGITEDTPWSCGLEFDYTNEESIYCRPIRLPEYAHSPIKAEKGEKGVKFTEIPDAATRVRVAFLPPMSGLAATEPKWERGRINVLIGEGQTAQVIRNLCYFVYHEDSQHKAWTDLCGHVESLFGVSLDVPRHISERGEVAMEYTDKDGTRLDLSSSGRGLLQTLLLLGHLYLNPNTVLLLDEPDAHLEILRQRQTFQLVTETAQKLGSQVIAASHSEIVLNEAAGVGKVVAFVGRPHVINAQKSQVLKALAEIGFEHYYQAEQMGWVLYVEDATDLAILRSFADILEHAAADLLKRPFVHYVGNLPQRARDHFFGLSEAKADLVGVAIFDRLDKTLKSGTPLTETMWTRREIENYFCSESVLLKFAAGDEPNDLFGLAEREKREHAMLESIEKLRDALRTFGKPDAWTPDIKATDDFLDPLFREFFKRLSLPLSLRKTDYHVLAKLVPAPQIDREIVEKLDLIAAAASRAKPRGDS